MFCIAGLGNNGEEYSITRHNAGFMFADKIASLLDANPKLASGEWKNEGAFISNIKYYMFSGEKIGVVAKPCGYMNNSGQGVSKIVDKCSIDVPNDLYIAYDDLDIELGMYKVQYDKTPKDHNGVNSVRTYLRSTEFYNIRIGINSRQNDVRIPGVDYVLMKMSQNELMILNTAIEKAAHEVIQLLCANHQIPD